MSHVFQAFQLEGSHARTDPVDGFNRRGEDRRFDSIERAWYRYLALGDATLACHLHVDAAYAPTFLQISNIELVPEQALGLAKYGAHDVALLYNALDLERRGDLVFDGTKFLKLLFGHVFCTIACMTACHPSKNSNSRTFVPSLP
jgi:hypothetical protein